jgi:hypothetical protein
MMKYSTNYLLDGSQDVYLHEEPIYMTIINTIYDFGNNLKNYLSNLSGYI